MAGWAFAVVWAMTLAFTLILVRNHPDTPGLARWPLPAALYSGVGIAISLALALVPPGFAISRNGSSASDSCSRSSRRASSRSRPSGLLT